MAAPLWVADLSCLIGAAAVRADEKHQAHHIHCMPCVARLILTVMHQAICATLMHVNPIMFSRAN